MTENAQTWHQDRPIYRQLMEQIVARILDNTYREGEMLPSVRQLASDFVVNPLTAARAYRELEEYTETRRGIGLVVKDGVRELLLKREQRVSCARNGRRSASASRRSISTCRSC